MNAKGTKGTSGNNRKVLTSWLYDHYLDEFVKMPNHILKTVQFYWTQIIHQSSWLKILKFYLGEKNL